MNFTRQSIWAECERLRITHDMSTCALSSLLFRGAHNTLYANRRNINDGGLNIPLTVLKYFGLKYIVLTKLNTLNKQPLDLKVVCIDRDIDNIREQLLVACNILAYDTGRSKLPQTIRQALNNKQVNITLTTFEKTFAVIGGVSCAFWYNTDKIMEDLFL